MNDSLMTLNGHQLDAIKDLQQQLTASQEREAELKLELITRTGELQVMSEEKAELMSYVEELRAALNYIATRDTYGNGKAQYCMKDAAKKALAKIPA